MKTNIEHICKNLYGKRIGEALYAIGGSAEEGWDTDVTGIYQLLNGNIIAYNGFRPFSVKDTDWSRGGYNPPIARGRAAKKCRRNERIDKMCGTWWNGPTKLKKLGKNRSLARRMAPNAKQLADFEAYLPF